MKITSTQSFSDTFIRNLYLFVILSLLLLTGQMWLSNILISLVFHNYLFMVVGWCMCLVQSFALYVYQSFTIWSVARIGTCALESWVTCSQLKRSCVTSWCLAPPFFIVSVLLIFFSFSFYYLQSEKAKFFLKPVFGACHHASFRRALVSVAVFRSFKLCDRPVCPCSFSKSYLLLTVILYAYWPRWTCA